MTTTQEGTSHRIVVGIDGSPSSLDALNWAVRQAELTGATLEALTSWEWPINYGAVYLPDGYDPAAEARKVLDEAVEAIREGHPAVTIRPVIVEGHPAMSLLEASRDADLLVVGSRGHGQFSGMLLGSVSQHCSHHAPCPILIVRA
jgi:nucleotide-binding universal stress UspA family protein